MSSCRIHVMNLTAALSLALAGCNQSAPPQAQSNNSPPPEPEPVSVAGDKDLTDEVAKELVNDAADSLEAMRKGRPARGSAGEPEEADEPDAKAAEPKTFAEAVQKLETNPPRTPEDLQRTAATLEKLLEDEPENVDGLLLLASITQFLGDQLKDAEAATASLHKSADFVRRAIQKQPELGENESVRQYTANALYKSAVAYAKEGESTEALAALREAITYGYSKPDQLESDKDLAEVRALPEYAALIASVRENAKIAEEKAKAAAAKEVAALLEGNDPFDFDFDLEDVNGKKISKADFAGKVLIVDVWGTWCPPCKMEIPHFVALDKEYREKGLQIIGLNSERTNNTEEAVELVKEFCKENGVEYPCALIDRQFIQQIPDFEGFPTTMFLDRSGTVRIKATGYHDEHFLHAAVEALLTEKVDDASPPQKTDEKTESTKSEEKP